MPDDASTLGQEALTVEMAPRVNLGFFHNSIPVISQMRILNDTDSPWEDVVVSMRCEPPFFREKSWRVDRVGAQASHYIEKPALEFDVALLERLTESEKAQLVWTLTVGDGRRHELVTHVDCLARNHWCGSFTAPELLASYVRPNDSVVDALLHKASDLLGQGGRDAAISGYKGGPLRAWEVASAIWSALAGWGLSYASLPAGFENNGQKIREPGRIFEGRVANCLDGTLLVCSALEQAGLHPLVVMVKGHAFPGLWLRPTEATAAVLDDPATLRNLLRIGHVILFESTYLTQRPCPEFARAIRQGADQVAEGHDGDFVLALDIRRARDKGFKPFGSERQASLAGSVEADRIDELALPSLPELAVADEEPEQAKPTTPEGRVQHWQRMLLNLSAKNTLLNFNPNGKKAVRFHVADAGGLEDMLAAEKKIRLLPAENLMRGDDARDADLFRGKTGEDAVREHARLALARGQVHAVSLGDGEFESRMTDLYRQARNDLQEGGANTLYLAFGFLSWRKAADTDRRYLAPLILVPVTLERRGVGGGFYLQAHEDDTRFNPTLLEMLRQDFDLELPYVRKPMPTDDHGVDVERVKREVSQAILGRAGWEVIDDLVLSTFSFAKYLMWKDLSDRLDLLKENAVVKHLIETPQEPFPVRVSFSDVRKLDAECPPDKLLCPVPADSSQLAAVAAASAGKNFIIIGPPGTGKSQTITNIIANALADGKRVLFVAEKIAALEVVHRRLAAIGLGEFCLELHSGKARKSEVLGRLKAAWDTARTREPQDWGEEALRLRRQRHLLNGFVEVLHRRRRNGLTVYEAVGVVVANPTVAQVEFAWADAEAHDAEGYAGLKASVEDLGGALSELRCGWPHPLAFVSNREPSALWSDGFVKQARLLITRVDAQEAAAKAFSEAAEVTADTLARSSFTAVSGLITLLPQAHGKLFSFLLASDAPTQVRRLGSGKLLLAEYRTLKASLATPWSDAVVSTAHRALKLLERYAKLRVALSVAYKPEIVVSVDFVMKLAEWQTARQSPFRWVPWLSRASKMKREMRSYCRDEAAVPAMPTDLETLAQMRELQSELESLAGALSPLEGLWAGLDTDAALVEAALAHRAALVAHADDDDFSVPGDAEVSLASGLCGGVMRRDQATMAKLTKLRAALAAYDDLGDVTEGLWAGLKTDTDRVAEALAFAEGLAREFTALATDAACLDAWRAVVARLLGPHNALLSPTGRFAISGAAYALAYAERRAAQAEWAASGAETMAEADAASVRNAVAACIRHVDELRAWCRWVKAREAAVSAGLAPLVAAVAEHALPPGELLRVFAVNYARWWVPRVEATEPVLREFSAESQERNIARFREMDDRFMRITKDYIRARLSAQVPASVDTAASDVLSEVRNPNRKQWGVLNREMSKKTKHKPIRELFETCTVPMSVLAPCLLMSPLSIAQYLSVEVAPFDMVVFDEASQIPTWDAIGAMARGRHVVMVGDPKQLPPTSFFQRIGGNAPEDEQGVEATTDLESILDECRGAGLPEWPLLWHYRSRDESLITFSNRRYYDGRLITFPSPAAKDTAVSLRHVADGVYERGRSRTNPVEAHALVSEIVSRLRDPEFRALRRSIGVVTFNAQQQELIEDLLDAERRKYPEIEEFFREHDEAGDQREYLFVKNLESVQGDERDIIYFSITFGRDAAGVLYKNFGPLNLDGGHRRLNVAVSRARREMRVFSSIKAEHLDLNAGQRQGPQDLKLFLDFAERGVSVLAAPPKGSVGSFESPFEEAVANALRAKGWEVRSQIGVSVFRIDLAVVHPAMPGRFLAGIECDGASYHSSATARDRDKLREQVLRGLGWEIHRVWSTDWWHDAARCINKLDAKLRAQMEQLPLN